MADSTLEGFHLALVGDLGNDTARWSEAMERLAEGPFAARRAVLRGRSDRGEVILLMACQSPSHAALQFKALDSEARGLKAKAVNLSLLTDDERAGLSRRLASFDAAVDPVEKPSVALAQLRKAMAGAAPAAPSPSPRPSPTPAPALVEPTLSLRFGSEEDLVDAWAKALAAGALFVPTSLLLAEGAWVKVDLHPGVSAPLEIRTKVLARRSVKEVWGVAVEPSPSLPLTAFLNKRAREKAPGKKVPASGDRQHDRFQTRLEVRFDNFPELSAEYASNISKGGLFVKTATPPSLRSKVQLALTLPNKETCEVEAEVVHVVAATPANQAAKLCGVGLSFVRTAEDFFGPIDRLLERYSARKPRVLVADDDALIAQMVRAGLPEADVEVAPTGEEAFRRLIDGLFEIDLLLLDLRMPGLGGAELLDRIRRLGGEADLKVVILSAEAEATLSALTGPGKANAAISKGQGVERILTLIRAMLPR